MFKRLFLTLGIIAGLAVPGYGAGLVPLSLQTVFTNTGVPASGCLLYTFQAATTTPQTVYQDSGLTLPYSNPTVCDQVGRLPQMFAADGNIKLRLTTSAGVELLAVDSVLVVGPSSGGGGGGGSVDATTILATGDVKVKYGTGALSGFVRLNGRTIGSATSGATERANADTQTLFEYLWNNDSTLSVSGGRGANAAADWAANKTIALPDMRGKVIAALDDLGTTPAGRLTSTYFGAGATTLGSSSGSESRTLATANLPASAPTGTVIISDPQHTHGIQVSTSPVTGGGALQVVTSVVASGGTAGGAMAAASTGITGSFVGNNLGSATPFTTLQPMMLMTVYIKL